MGRKRSRSRGRKSRRSRKRRRSRSRHLRKRKSRSRSRKRPRRSRSNSYKRRRRRGRSRSKRRTRSRRHPDRRPSIYTAPLDSDDDDVPQPYGYNYNPRSVFQPPSDDDTDDDVVGPAYNPGGTVYDYNPRADPVEIKREVKQKTIGWGWKRKAGLAMALLASIGAPLMSGYGASVWQPTSMPRSATPFAPASKNEPIPWKKDVIHEHMMDKVFSIKEKPQPSGDHANEERERVNAKAAITLFGDPRTQTKRELRKKRGRLALYWHPDKYRGGARRGDEAIMKIATAYEWAVQHAK